MKKKNSNMSSEKSYIHHQDLQEFILQKQSQVAELQEQYKQYEIKSVTNTIEELNSRYLALKAENTVLKSANPQVIPKCKNLLFAWAHQRLQADVRNLEELLSYQKSMKDISCEKELELRKISQEGSSQSPTLLLRFEEEKDIENLRSDILRCLHVKLIRRLRRITREHFPAVTNNGCQTDKDVRKQEKKKSLFTILQALFPDLKEGTFKADEEEVVGAYIKNSYPKEYVDLLVSSKIVDLEKPNFMKIVNR